MVGEDYLRFNELNARLIFGKGSNERKNKECAAKLGMEILYLAVTSATNAENPFVRADLVSISGMPQFNIRASSPNFNIMDEFKIMDEVGSYVTKEHPTADYKSLYENLCAAVLNWKEDPFIESVFSMTGLAEKTLPVAVN